MIIIVLTIDRVPRWEEALRRAVCVRGGLTLAGACGGPAKFPHSTPHTSGLTSPEDACFGGHRLITG